MSKTYKVFIIGNLECQDNTENIRWNLNIKDNIKKNTEKQIQFICTQDYFDAPYTDEIMTWELNQIQDSDIIIVNLTNIAHNISTYYLLGYIKMLNQIKSKHIYIIGIGSPNTDNYWIKYSFFKMIDTIENAAKYITNYLLL